MYPKSCYLSNSYFKDAPTVIVDDNVVRVKVGENARLGCSVQVVTKIFSF